MNLGIMQGRLSKPVNGHMQEFPPNWQAEFELLSQCGLSHIEWLITKGSTTHNPAFDTSISLKEYPISSLCADTLVDSAITNEDYLRKHLEPICESAIRNEINMITIPLLEESNMEDAEKRQKFKTLIREYTIKYPDLQFSFECELTIAGLQDILQLSNNFYVTYDTGNITSYNIEHSEYISTFHERINNVHLKDRTFNAETVSPTKGNTDFALIFENLSLFGYNGPYTMQTARGKTGHEIDTVLQHKTILEGLHNAK